LLTSNFYGYRVDLSSLIYPPESGYPHFYMPPESAKWVLELNSNGLFDALTPAERVRLAKFPVVSSHFIIHNQSMPDSFVSSFSGHVLENDLKRTLAKRFSVPEFQ